MDSARLKVLLNDVRSGKLDIASALNELKHLPYEDLDFARVDHHRSLRQGVPEVVFAEGKRPEDVVSIAKTLHKRSKRVLITRATEAIYKKLRLKAARFHVASGVIAVGGSRKASGNVLVVSAGTSDVPVAEEAAITARFLGSRTTTIYDAGVAGIHRLFGSREALEKANSIVVVAGMEGALPSVVGGITDKPIVAVPTSVGYGASLGGLTALFAMLNSCVPGIAVMNIDNGFGAGCLAHKINMLATR
jgi:NCAIR mutase (PurE)-related protein